MTQTKKPEAAKSNLDSIRTAPGAFYIGYLGGKERYIRFDLNAFAEMENKFGTMELAQERLKGGSMKDVKTVLWLGLIWDEAVLDEVTGEPIKYNITEYQVGSWLTSVNLEATMNTLQQAITGALPKEAGKSSAEAMDKAVEATGEVPN